MKTKQWRCFKFVFLWCCRLLEQIWGRPSRSCPQTEWCWVDLWPLFPTSCWVLFCFNPASQQQSVSCCTTIYRETCDNKISETCCCHRKCRLQKQYSPSPMMNDMYLLHTTQKYIYICLMFNGTWTLFKALHWTCLVRALIFEEVKSRAFQLQIERWK